MAAIKHEMIEADEAKDRLHELIGRASSGQEVIIRTGEIQVRLVPVDERKPRRSPGSAKGLIELASDFDEPLEAFAPYR